MYSCRLTVIEKKSSKMSQSTIFPLLTYLYVLYFWVNNLDTRWLNPPNKGIYLQKVYSWKSMKLISGLSNFTAEIDFIVPSSKQPYILRSWSWRILSTFAFAPTFMSAIFYALAAYYGVSGFKFITIKFPSSSVIKALSYSP